MTFSFLYINFYTSSSTLCCACVGGHCKSLAPEYKKVAKALKGVVKVGSVDCDEHKDLAGKFGVSGFPTIKIFSGKDNTVYQGERTAKAIAEAGLAAARKKVKEQLDGKSSSGSGSGSKSGSKDDVVELTESNFEKLVLNSDDVWLVEFFAPWCKLLSLSLSNFLCHVISYL